MRGENGNLNRLLFNTIKLGYVELCLTVFWIMYSSLFKPILRDRDTRACFSRDN